MGRVLPSAASARSCLAVLIILLAVSIPATSGARWIDLGGEAVTVNLVEDDGYRTVFEVRIGGFEAEEVSIGGETWYDISIEGEGRQEEVGFPALPNIRRSLIIPDDQRMAVNLLASEFVDFPDMPVAPSKGHLLRSVDPASVPYTFDPFYHSGGVYPATPLESELPYILRDFRGLLVDANAFQYLPATRTLRVHTRLLIEVVPVGPGETNVLERTGLPEKIDRQFANLYEDHFINYGSYRYTPVLEDGGILIITYDAFLGNIQPLADWKLQKGIPTKLVTLAETGSTWTQIANYIQNEFDNWNLAYVLLIGDAEQMPKPSGDSDPLYTLVAGSDNYPDLFVGRFSAEDPAEVDTQVERTITYERDQVSGQVWPQSGTGVASNEGPGHYGEYDNEHSDLIRQDLLNYGYYGVDQIYDPGATASEVAVALNEGRGIVNYTGHGWSGGWSTTGFANANVNALTNDDMLPFICSVACNNGTFTGGTCFAEAWLRATHNGAPTGAIAAYMSYISQSWDPPMYAQDEAVDLLVADQLRTIGGLWYNGSCHMMDMTGSIGVEEFKNWTLFGDPSACVRTKTAAITAVNHAGALFIGMNEYEVNVAGLEGALCALYADGVLYGSALTNAAGQATISMADPPAEPMTLTLTVTAYNMVTVMDPVEVLPPSGPYLIFETCAVIDSDGDADGELDEGELVGLDITLENVGVDPTTGVSAILSSEDPYVTIIEGERDFPDIPAGANGTCTEPYVIQVAGNAPDEHMAQFSIEATANEGSWDAAFSLDIQAPLLAATGCVVIDSPGGNGDGNANPGETITLRVWLENAGHSDAEQLTGTLSSMSFMAQVIDPTGECELVPIAGDALMGDFELAISQLCPEPTHLLLGLEITDPNGLAVLQEVNLSIGGWFDDLEVDRGWTVGAPDDDASSGIWVCADPVGTTYGGYQIQPEDDHTPAPGAMCFVTGNGTPGGAAGENDVDSGKTTLLTPVFRLADATSATVSYWRWYTNARGNNPDQDWWDVDVTNDGQNWVSLEHTQASQEEWVEYTFELTDYIALTDQVQIRFVAADESPGSLVEAAVDDFLLTAIIPQSSSVEDGRGELPAMLALAPNAPNPFSPETTIRFSLPRKGEVELAVFDISGRKIVSLVSGELEPGRHTLVWQGLDQSGREVANGLYFSRLQFGGEVLTGRMILLK
jgi:hypothetical protein